MTYTRWACVGSRGGADADARPQRSLRTMRPYLAAVITAAGTPSLRLPWLAAIRRWGYAVYGCFSSRSYGCADSQSTAALARDHPAAPTRSLKPHWLAVYGSGLRDPRRHRHARLPHAVYHPTRFGFTASRGASVEGGGGSVGRTAASFLSANAGCSASGSTRRDVQ